MGQGESERSVRCHIGMNGSCAMGCDVDSCMSREMRSINAVPMSSSGFKLPRRALPPQPQADASNKVVVQPDGDHGVGGAMLFWNGFQHLSNLRGRRPEVGGSHGWRVRYRSHRAGPLGAHTHLISAICRQICCVLPRWHQKPFRVRPGSGSRMMKDGGLFSSGQRDLG